ncbi:hypothetical protein I552_8189 [Mycobacterium xenopi 3993]|nr:hypothetical protein I552_8189 [Mycobacterium xenopi 3993]
MCLVAAGDRGDDAADADEDQPPRSWATNPGSRPDWTLAAC